MPPARTRRARAGPRWRRRSIRTRRSARTCRRARGRSRSATPRVLAAHEAGDAAQRGEDQGEGELGGAGLVDALGVAQPYAGGQRAEAGLTWSMPADSVWTTRTFGHRRPAGARRPPCPSCTGRRRRRSAAGSAGKSGLAVPEAVVRDPTRRVRGARRSRRRGNREPDVGGAVCSHGQEAMRRIPTQPGYFGARHTGGVRQVERRTIGAAALDVGAIGLGCMPMSWAYSRFAAAGASARCATVHAALDAGREPARHRRHVRAVHQ